MTLRPLFSRIGDVAPLIDRGYAILTPNRRLSRAVRAADDARRIAAGAQAWPSATIQPLRQFWSDQWQRAVTRGLLPARELLDVTRQQLLWQTIIDADGQAGFSLLNTARAAELSRVAYEQLVLWQVERGQAPWSSWFGLEADSGSFLRWAARFEQVLEDLGALTPEQAQQQLLADLSPAARRDLAVPAVALLYPDPLPPLHRALAAMAPDTVTLELPAPAAQLAPVLAFADPACELEAAARWCRERVESDPAGRYAVVLQDMQGPRAQLETLLRREFDCLTRNYDSLPVNFATGFTLDQVPLVRDALRILSLYGRRAGVEDAIAVLQSRFVQLPPLQEDLIEGQLRRLRELAHEQVPARVLREVLAPLAVGGDPPPPWDAGLLLDSRGQRLGRERRPSEWLLPLRTLLAAWGWAEGQALDSLEYQQRAAWEEALDAFALLDPICGSLDFEAALALLRTVLAAQPFQPLTSDRALQVLGPLETTGLTFDGLWLAGMSTGTWPARARPNPYLPLALQRQLRMPGADAAWEWQRAQRRWQHWQASAAQLQASFLAVQDDAEQLPSPLLAGVAIRAVDGIALVDPRWEAQRDNTLDIIALPEVPLTEAERSAGAASALLEAQVECPFKAFARGRLRVEPAPAISAGLLPWERGTLLHRALHHLFGVFPDRAALRSASAAAQGEAIDDAVLEARAAVHRNRRAVLGSAALALEEQRLARLLAAWLALESGREEAFEVIAREQERELQIGGLVLRLRVDRVDRFDDGRTLIVDYKSGTPENLARWFDEPPGRPQLPLYALLEPAADGICYAVLRREQLCWSGVGERAFVDGLDTAAKRLGDAAAGEDEAMAVLRQRWARSLAQLAGAYCAGVSDVAPRAGACRRCGRQALCRIDEQRR